MTNERTDRFADKFPTADELAMLREAYAETYPVRPLLNEIERLRGLLAETLDGNHDLDTGVADKGSLEERIRDHLGIPHETRTLEPLADAQLQAQQSEIPE